MPFVALLFHSSKEPTSIHTQILSARYFGLLVVQSYLHHLQLQPTSSCYFQGKCGLQLLFEWCYIVDHLVTEEYCLLTRRTFGSGPAFKKL